MSVLPSLDSLEDSSDRLSSISQANHPNMTRSSITSNITNGRSAAALFYSYVTLALREEPQRAVPHLRHQLPG